MMTRSQEKYLAWTTLATRRPKDILPKHYCAWCFKEIRGDFDLHEYLVKRSAVPKSKQHLIMCPENWALLHHECHMKGGQTRKMTVACLRQAMAALGGQRVAQWYISLWRDHGLSVPRGPDDWGIHCVSPQNIDGLVLLGRWIDDPLFEEQVQWTLSDGTDLCRVAWELYTGQRERFDYPLPLYRYAENGFWFLYMSYVLNAMWGDDEDDSPTTNHA